MKNSRNINKCSLEYRVQLELLGRAIERSLPKVNSENLATNGEICFPSNLLAWRGLLPEDGTNRSSRNILEYYLRRKTYETIDFSDPDILRKASELLAAASQDWPSQIQRCSLQDGRVALFLNRTSVIGSVIEQALMDGAAYGGRTATGKRVCIKINEDVDSDLTTARLRLVRQVSEQLLRFQGFAIVESNADYLYLLTSKSEGKTDERCRRSVCGVVKNQESNTKETSETWETYVENKMEELSSLGETKSSQRDNLRSIAEAVATFELLSVKPSKPVFVGSSKERDKAHSSSKEGSFVLYNSSRINAILERFEEEKLLGKYPSLMDVKHVDFGLLNQEEEWELVYNFVVGFPEMIQNCVRCGTQRLETCPQSLCLFLSRLSQKFSVYYRRIRILTEGRDHLIPTMMARLHLLRALRVVVNNSLEILNIVPVDHM